MRLVSRLFSRRAPVYRLPQGKRIYAIGDIHGRSDALAKLLAQIDIDAENAPGDVQLVFLGDYIDRGINSREVIELLCRSGRHSRIFLKGNHEEVLLQFLDNPPVLRDWMQFGGLATLCSYGITLPQTLSGIEMQKIQWQFNDALPPAHREFFARLKPSYECGDYFFVHAGIHPYRALANQRERDFFWIREPFLRHKGSFRGRYIVHGHTPQESPDILPHRANLDVSNAPSEQLAALVIEGDSRRALVVESSAQP